MLPTDLLLRSFPFLFFYESFFFFFFFPSPSLSVYSSCPLKPQSSLLSPMLGVFISAYPLSVRLFSIFLPKPSSIPLFFCLHPGNFNPQSQTPALTFFPQCRTSASLRSRARPRHFIHPFVSVPLSL